MPEHEIDLLIAQHLAGEDCGSREDDDEERLFIARRWFASVQGRLREAVCGNPAVVRAAENPGEGNRLPAAAVVDAVLRARLPLDVPATVLAAKVVADAIGARAEPVAVARDCSDGLFEAYWRRPGAYPENHVRRATSVWTRVGPEAEQRAVRSLGDDLESRRWAERNGDLADSTRQISASACSWLEPRRSVSVMATPGGAAGQVRR